MRGFKEIFERLLQFPNLSGERPELVIGIRSFAVGKYVVLYQPASEVLEIVRVRHSATKSDEQFEIEGDVDQG